MKSLEEIIKCLAVPIRIKKAEIIKRGVAIDTEEYREILEGSFDKIRDILNPLSEEDRKTVYGEMSKKVKNESILDLIFGNGEDDVEAFKEKLIDEDEDGINALVESLKVTNLLLIEDDELTNS